VGRGCVWLQNGGRKQLSSTNTAVITHVRATECSLNYKIRFWIGLKEIPLVIYIFVLVKMGGMGLKWEWFSYVTLRYTEPPTQFPVPKVQLFVFGGKLCRQDIKILSDRQCTR
jgi:hypothetical protein